MPNRIKNKTLWRSIGKLKQKDWIKASKRLGLNVSTTGGRGSHCVIRDPKFKNPNDTRSLIATIQKNLFKQANETIFKQFINSGILEDDIWRALKMLK